MDAVESLNNGQRETWAEVCIELYSRLLGVAHRLTHDPAESQDLVQETIMRSLTYTAYPQKVNEPLRYLCKLMRHVWLDGKRRHKAAIFVSLDHLLTSELPESQNLFEIKYLCLKSDVQQLLENKEFVETLRANLEPLSFYERQLLNLRLREYTSDEIAKELGKNVRLIRSDLNALMAKIRYRLRHKAGRPGNKPRLALESGDYYISNPG